MQNRSREDDEKDQCCDGFFQQFCEELKLLTPEHVNIPSLKLTAKATEGNVVFQPSIFRGKLLFREEVEEKFGANYAPFSRFGMAFNPCWVTKIVLQIMILFTKKFEKAMKNYIRNHVVQITL